MAFKFIFRKRGKILDGLDMKERGRIWWAVIGVIGFIFLVKLVFGLIGYTSSGYYTIKQTWIFGDLVPYMSPGIFPRLLGKVTRYKYSDIIYFSKHRTEGTRVDESIFVRFNDGGTAMVTGNVRYILDSSPRTAVLRHRHFRSHENLLRTCLIPMVKESVILTAAMMSSEESYTTKRSLFSELARDQIAGGVFLTEQEEIKRKDPKTDEETIRYSVKVKLDKDGNPLRKHNPLLTYGVTMQQFVIKEIDYEKDVLKQIEAKREALMQTISARAEAEKAVQQRLTAEEEGKKNVAVAEYKARVFMKKAIVDANKRKEVAVTQANKRLEVAKLDSRSAQKELEAKTLRAKAEYEVARKRLLADGAVNLKGEAYLEIVKAWSSAFQHAGQPLVPEVSSQQGMNGVTVAFSIMQTIIDKLSKDFGISLIPGKSKIDK